MMMKMGIIMKVKAVGMGISHAMLFLMAKLKKGLSRTV